MAQCKSKKAKAATKQKTSAKRVNWKGKKNGKKAVEAPKGFHWMKSGKGFKLMKGDYKPHKGAVRKASFEIQKVHKA